ncbi:uncharacterized protein [Solanum lycopersicum]|uniref:uncharacterized protein n=1 Tax=Solanum lycopersicum TaxID=4081 RepID=UPI00374A3338
MGSVAHVEEEMKELVKDVHRLDCLGVHLMSISDSGVTIQNGAESSLLVEIKEKRDSELRQHILAEAHNSMYSIHPSSTKMYCNLREVYWWNGMKRDITDFVKLPRTRRQNDSIWVIIDRMTKYSRFLAVKTKNSVKDYVKLHINEIVRLHGVPLSIISNRGPRLTSNF